MYNNYNYLFVTSVGLRTHGCI